MQLHRDIEQAERVRQERGDTKTATALRIGAAPSTYTRWVRCEHELNDEHIYALALDMGLKASTFLRCKYARRVGLLTA